MEVRILAEYSIKDIAVRIKNIEGTRQIIKAMELISSSKLQKYKVQLEKTRLFSDSLNKSIKNIYSDRNLKNFICKENNTSQNSCYILIGSDKGMAGGYNINILKLFEESKNSKEDIVLPIGKKMKDYFFKKNFILLSDKFYSCEKLSFEECKKISDVILNKYYENNFSKVFLIYTKFISPLKQVSSIVKLFPIDSQNFCKNNKSNKLNFLCEPNYEECIKGIIPYYMSGTIWSAVCESLASEYGARHTAMESANKNACEMVDGLRLAYNQLRQSSITQEITEIVAGT